MVSETVPSHQQKRSLRQLNGGARHLIDLRARRSFEHSGCSELVSSTSFALLVMGSVESRRMHQMHLVKLENNKGDVSKQILTQAT